MEYNELLNMFVVLTPFNNIYFLLGMDRLKPDDPEKLENLDLSACFLVDNDHIVRFKILDNPNRIMFFLKTQNCKSNCAFDKVGIINSNLKTNGMCSLPAEGSSDFSTVATNEDGSEVFSIKAKKESWELCFNVVSIKSNKNNTKMFHKFKGIIKFPSFNEIENAPVGLCYAYLKNLLIISCETGKIFLFKVTITENDSKKPQVKLEKIAQNDFFTEQGEGLYRNSFRNFILSYDHEYVITRTRHSAIHVLKLSEKDLKPNRIFESTGTIVHINLSLNGRFLLQCGTFFSSVAMIDLSTIDKESFGENSPNFLVRARMKADESSRENGDKQTVLSKKLETYLPKDDQQENENDWYQEMERKRIYMKTIREQQQQRLHREREKIQDFGNN